MTEEFLEPGKRQPNFRRSYETSRLVEALNKMEPGETLTYGKLSEFASMDVDGATPALISARRIVQSENGYITDAVWGVGIKRLTDEEIVEAATKGTASLARRARAESHKLSRSDFAALNEDKRKKYAVHQSVFGAIAAISSSKGVAVIEKNVVGEIMRLPVKETMKLFQG